MKRSRELDGSFTARSPVINEVDEVDYGGVVDLVPRAGCVHGKWPQRRSRREGFEHGSSEQDFTSAVQAANYSHSGWEMYV